MKRERISLILNIIIVLLVLIGTIFMFCGIKFMPESNLMLEDTKIQMFKYYTVDSNILLGIISFVLVLYEYKLLKEDILKIPKKVYILKFVGTASITLTFLTTLFFLTPQYGFYAMYNNNNLFFHLIVPLLAIISYVFFEKHDNSYKYAVFGIVPMFFYSIYYILNVIIHLKDGLMYKYDFYGFLQGNINNIFIAVPIIFFITYLISFGLIFFNKKNYKL